METHEYRIQVKLLNDSKQELYINGNLGFQTNPVNFLNSQENNTYINIDSVFSFFLYLVLLFMADRQDKRSDKSSGALFTQAEYTCSTRGSGGGKKQ